MEDITTEPAGHDAAGFLMSARTYQVAVQLTRDGHRCLDERMRAHVRLHNAALQERRDAWRMARKYWYYESLGSDREVP